MLALLPLPKAKRTGNDQADNNEDEGYVSDSSNEDASDDCCNARRIILWCCGVLCTAIEIVGTSLQLMDVSVIFLGFTVSSLLTFSTIVIAFFVIVAWAIMGFLLTCRLQTAVDAEPRIRSLILLFQTHLIILLTVYVIFAVIGVLYDGVLSSSPYLYTVSITLHRACEFFVVYSLLRIIDGTGSGFVILFLWAVTRLCQLY